MAGKNLFVLRRIVGRNQWDEDDIAYAAAMDLEEMYTSPLEDKDYRVFAKEVLCLVKNTAPSLFAAIASRVADNEKLQIEELIKS